MKKKNKRASSIRFVSYWKKKDVFNNYTPAIRGNDGRRKRKGELEEMMVKEIAQGKLSVAYVLIVDMTLSRGGPIGTLGTDTTELVTRPWKK